MNTAFVVGHTYTGLNGSGPIVLRTRDGGATWVEMAHPFRQHTRNSFYAIHFINQTTGWVVGGSGNVIKTTNGGSTWADVSVPTEEPLSDVSFADANNGWVVGFGGIIFRTSDGGATWQKQNVGTTDAILSVSAVSPSVAWIGCYGFPGFVARTADGGVTWPREYPDAAPNGNPGGVSSYSAILFFKAEEGWVAGYSGIYRRGAPPAGPTAYSISGQVLDSANAGLANVTLTLSGSQAAQTSTDAQGNYSFTNVGAAGNYTVTPAKDGYVFTPAQQTFEGLNADRGANFIGTAAPAPTPTPTPTPTPEPSAPTLFVEEGNNRLAAVDSVLLTRGPFTLKNDHNFSSDRRTRIGFLTTDLGFNELAQPDIDTLAVNVGGMWLPVESVAPAGILGASYVVFRLPDLPPGDWPVYLRIRGLVSLNGAIVTVIE